MRVTFCDNQPDAIFGAGHTEEFNTVISAVGREPCTWHWRRLAWSRTSRTRFCSAMAPAQVMTATPTIPLRVVCSIWMTLVRTVRN